MAQGVITLCEMRAKGVTMLALACNRCERRGRPKIERLTARACRTARPSMTAAPCIFPDCRAGFESGFQPWARRRQS